MQNTGAPGCVIWRERRHSHALGCEHGNLPIRRLRTRPVSDGQAKEVGDEHALSANRTVMLALDKIAGGGGEGVDVYRVALVHVMHKAP